jgi:ribosomal protein L37AE/L43A
MPPDKNRTCATRRLVPRQSYVVITRRHVQCRSCDEEFVLRVGVAGGDQRFIFECPRCRVALRGALYSEPGELGDANPALVLG